MQYSTLIIGILPLVFFVIVDIFAGLKTALITAIFLAMLEGLYCYFYIGSLDYFSIVTIVTLIGFGAFSYYSKSATPFKMQPAVFSLLIGLVFLVSFYIDKPLLPYLFERYAQIIPPNLAHNLKNPMFIRLTTLSTHYLGYLFLIHATAIAYAARKLSNWWWLLIRVGGFYTTMLVGVMLANFHMVFFS